jgi:hypothetical protein
VHRHCVAQYSAGKALKERLPAIIGSSDRNHPLQLGGNRSAETLPDTVKQVVLRQGCQASGCPTGTAGTEDIQVDWVTIDNPA